MKACATCQHWAITTSPLRLADLAPCVHSPRWEHLPPAGSCERHKPLEAVLFAKRARWLARIENKHQGVTK